MGDPQICEAHGCSDEVEAVNVEAFELTGKALCESCAEEAFEKAAQQGGAE
ncbi:MAG TPA: hypothetical protein PKY87_12815 [Terricaulis sp.]|nr:hypothetical protein [Terricaulis sp.]